MKNFKVSVLVKGKLVELTSILADRFESPYGRANFFVTNPTNWFGSDQGERLTASFPDHELYISE